MGLRGGRARPDVSRLAERFPDAPRHYGPSESYKAPEPSDSGTGPPPFSWIGKVDAAGFKYVASRRGRHFYPIDAPAAALIRAEDFVGYATAADARGDGLARAGTVHAGPVRNRGTEVPRPEE